MVPREKALEGAEMVVRAEEFARTNLRVDRTECGDHQPVLLDQGEYPNFAEYDFRVDEAGLFELHALYAADQSRPVDVYVDGRRVVRAGLAGTTGSFKASSARWERQGTLFLTAGEHTLRLERTAAVPHIAALALRRDPRQIAGATLEALPSEAYIRDDFLVQEWMIWSIPGIQSYTVRDGAYVIQNGRHSFNRPLFGPPGPIVPFVGDRPQWLLAEIGRHKLGILSLAVGNRWLHLSDEVESAYNAGRMRHAIRLPEGEITITTLRLPSELLEPETAPDPGGHETARALPGESYATPPPSGVILRLESEKPVEIRWVFGGVRGGFQTDWAGAGGWTGGLHAGDAAGNHLEIHGSAAVLHSPDVPERSVAVAASAGSARLVTMEDGSPDTLFAGDGDENPGAGGSLHIEGQPVYLVIAAGAPAPDVAGLASEGAETFRRAEEAWRLRAERLAVSTPVPELDAAVRANNSALDGIWRPPSFLHGAVRWGDRGWYLGWRGWYGPICAGDSERVREAIRFHASHAIEEPETGVQSRGAFHAFISFDGTPERCAYDMNQVFLDQIRSYYAWTGDLETIRVVWPAVKRCLEYERREMDPDGDGLYTNDLNTFISDGHHYNGGGCTQASAYLYRINRFAADVASRLGEDPQPYLAEAEKIRSAVQSRLWMERPGAFAEYVDRDGTMHTAAEAATVYLAVECGLAEPLQAIRATEYLTRRLWWSGGMLARTGEATESDALILANDWFPVIVTNGCLNHNETLHSALAYFIAGDVERAWRLLRTTVSSFHRAAVPGSTSCYAGPRGEQGVYVDFADAASLFTRCVVEGLFGLEPDRPRGQVTWTPRFPTEWPRATLRTAGYTLSYQRDGMRESYSLEMPDDLVAVLRLPLRFDRLKSVTVNGRPASYHGEPGLDRQVIRVTAPAGRKAVVELTYSHRARFRVVDPPAWATAGDPVVVTATAGEFVGVEDAQGALRGGRVVDGHVEGRAGRQGRHIFHTRLRLPHSEVIHPVCLEVRPAFELLSAELKVSAAFPGEALLEVTLRCNRPERVPPPVEILYAGRTYRSRIGKGEPVSSEPAASGKRGSGDGRRRAPGPSHAGAPRAEVFRFRVKAPERLSPGGIPVRVTLRLLSGPVVLEGQTRLWSLFAAWPDGARAFAARCTPLEIPRNDCLEALFTRTYEGEDAPFLNCWTWYEPEVINLEHVRERLRGGLFESDVGVLFRIPSEGDNILCVTRWSSHPTEATIPVGRPAEVIYLLLANVTQNSQTHLAQARVHIEYADGREERIDLRGPGQIDHMLQHYAAANYPQWVGGKLRGYYGHGRASGTHADIVDLHPRYREPIARLRVECLTRETLIGILGVTLL